EFEPLAVRDQMSREAHLRDQLIVRWGFVIETEAMTIMANCVNAGRYFNVAAWSLCCPRRLPFWIIGRVRRILREGVQNVGDQQFLVLLLVMQPDFDNREYALGLRRRYPPYQSFDRRIDVRAVSRDVFAIRPRDQATLWSRMTGTGRDVVGIKKKRKPLVENLVSRIMGYQQKLLEEPCHMSTMPFGRTGVRHRLHDLVFG